MATAETNIVNAIMKIASPSGVRLFRNVRGMFFTKDGRAMRAGLLAEGASDLIGFKPITITQDMVGKKISIIVALEIKTETGRVSPEQINFIDFIKQNGGIAGVARCTEDAKKILDIYA